MSEIMPSDCGICDECGYWRPVTRPAESGQCRRYPPTFRPSDSQPRFPETASSDWCGEFIQFGKRRRGP